MDLFERGLAWMEEQRRDYAGVAVTYVRGGQQVEAVATIGRSTFEQVDELGVVHRVESRDYLIPSESLVIGGVRVLPQAGDRIRESDGTRTHTYEVMALGGEPPWRYSDRYHRTLRIHTMFVRVE